MQLYNRSTLITDGSILYNWKVLGNTAKTKYLVIDKDENTGNGKLNINFPEPGQNKTEYNQIIQCEASYEGQSFYCCYPVVIAEAAGRDAGSDVNRLSLDNNFYLKQILYSAAGRTPLYNKQQGVKFNDFGDRYAS